MKSMKKRQVLLHRGFALIALLTISVFWMATIISEVFFDKNAVITVKQSIAYYGLAIMILSMAGTGITGFLMSKNSTYPLIVKKRKRMPFIAGNGLLLIICALILSIKASNNTFDITFYSIQITELVLGAIQLILIIKQMITGNLLVKNSLIVNQL